MADFVAVLRKTIGALGDNTPAMRDKVYEKARTTIEAKLAALNPPPPAAVVERQRQALEDAIAAVRAEYDAPPSSPDETFEDVFSSLTNIAEPKAGAAAPRASAAPVAARHQLAGDGPAAAVAVAPEVRPAAGDMPQVDTGTPPPPGRRQAGQAPSRGRAGLVAALVVALLVIGGGAYALWQNRDDLMQLTGLGAGPVPAGEEVAATGGEPAPEATAAEESTPEPQDMAAAPATPPPAVEAEAEKFTQRLLPDGSEVDEGPAGGPRSVGEGSSVASAQVPPVVEAPAQQTGAESAGEEVESNVAAAAEEAAGETPRQPPAEQAVAVGQRAIFYEERTSSAQGSAETGAIVWSVVNESPGGDLPPEPAIRAEATIPGKDVQLRMTIRRNGDETLPASHIVEMIFLTPDGFEGGAISNVARIAFKETEQAAGSPLIGIPAKIADGFFLIALGDAPAEVEANMTLLRRQSWIDIPIVYQSGRRALLSLEKGIPGDQVFQETLRAWSGSSSG